MDALLAAAVAGIAVAFSVVAWGIARRLDRLDQERLQILQAIASRDPEWKIEPVPPTDPKRAPAPPGGWRSYVAHPDGSVEYNDGELVIPGSPKIPEPRVRLTDMER